MNKKKREQQERNQPENAPQNPDQPDVTSPEQTDQQKTASAPDSNKSHWSAFATLTNAYRGIPVDVEKLDDAQRQELLKRVELDTAAEGTQNIERNRVRHHLADQLRESK